MKFHPDPVIDAAREKIHQEYVNVSRSIKTATEEEMHDLRKKERSIWMKSQLFIRKNHMYYAHKRAFWREQLANHEVLTIRTDHNIQEDMYDTDN